jgi:hypothetical protein
MVTKYKTFKDYYHNNEEFRKKHLDKMSEKITCCCGFETARCNLSRHMRSRTHLKNIGNLDEINRLKKEEQKIKKEINVLLEKKNKIKKKINKLEAKN